MPAETQPEVDERRVRRDATCFNKGVLPEREPPTMTAAKNWRVQGGAGVSAVHPVEKSDCNLWHQDAVCGPVYVGVARVGGGGNGVRADVSVLVIGNVAVEKTQISAGGVAG